MMVERTKCQQQNRLEFVSREISINTSDQRIRIMMAAGTVADVVVAASAQSSMMTVSI
jgi:hypothetical protein